MEAVEAEVPVIRRQEVAAAEVPVSALVVAEVAVVANVAPMVKEAATLREVEEKEGPSKATLALVEQEAVEALKVRMFASYPTRCERFLAQGGGGGGGGGPGGGGEGGGGYYAGGGGTGGQPAHAKGKGT